jgi:O-antigen/teichoic acid export membrane protein
MLNRYFSIYLAAHLVPASIGFFAITAYTRLLSPAEYGVYVVGMSIAGILGAVFFAWIRLSVSRYQATSAIVDFRGTAIVAFGLTVLAICSIAPVAILFHRDVSVNLLGASIFVAITVNAVEIGQEFERANFRPYRFAAIAVVRSVSGLAFGLLAIELGWGGLGLIAAFGTSSLIGAAMNVAGSSKRIARWQPTQLMQFARYGLPLSIGGLSGALYSASDRLIVAYLLGEGAAGLFGVAADLPRQFLVMLASSVAAATFPIVFRTLTDKGDIATRERLNESVELLLSVVLPVVIWLALAADRVAGTLVGTEFRASVTFLLPVLAVARLFGVVNQFYFQISFQLSERPFLSVAQSCFTLILGISLMFPLVAGYGLFGAALATLITEAAGLLVAIYLARHAFRLPLDVSRLSGVAASVIIMGVAIFVTKSVVHGTGWYSLLTVSLVGGVAYTGAGWLFNVAQIRTLSIKTLRSRTLTKNALREQRRMTS